MPHLKLSVENQTDFGRGDVPPGGQLLMSKEKPVIAIGHHIIDLLGHFDIPSPTAERAAHVDSARFAPSVLDPRSGIDKIKTPAFSERMMPRESHDRQDLEIIPVHIVHTEYPVEGLATVQRSYGVPKRADSFASAVFEIAVDTDARGQIVTEFFAKGVSGLVAEYKVQQPRWKRYGIGPREQMQSHRRGKARGLRRGEVRHARKIQPPELLTVARHVSSGRLARTVHSVLGVRLWQVHRIGLDRGTIDTTKFACGDRIGNFKVQIPEVSRKTVWERFGG